VLPLRIVASGKQESTTAWVSRFRPITLLEHVRAQLVEFRREMPAERNRRTCDRSAANRLGGVASCALMGFRQSPACRLERCSGDGRRVVGSAASKLGDEFAACADTNLAEHRFEMVLDGVRGDVEPLGNLLGA
jgi:hypothetical protein